MRLRRAFTLVELLVVIGIIAVLISVLLPALKMAREQALSAQCLANLRQCGQALYMYANQNRGFFPQMQLQEPQALPFGQKITGEQGIPPSGQPDFYYPSMRDSLFRILNPGRDPTAVPFTPGGLLIFYCPANFFWDGDIPGVAAPTLTHWPEDFWKSNGRIKYRHLGRPNPEYPLC